MTTTARPPGSGASKPSRRRTLLGAAAGIAGLACPEVLLPRPGVAQDGRKVIPFGVLLQAGSHAGGIEMASAKGFFAEQGLQIDRKQYNAGANLLQALAGGDIVAGVCGCNPTLLLKAQGVDVKILANANREGSALVVGPDVKNPKDLDGRKVATPGIAAIQDTLMRIYESQNGIRVEHVFVKVTDMPIMLRNREIAGYIVWEVSATAGLAMGGGRILATSHEIRSDHECCVLVASGKFLKDEPDAALHLVRAFAMGMKHAIENPDELVQVIAKSDHITPEQAREALKHVRYAYPPLNDVAELSFIVKSLVDVQKIEKSRVPDIDRFLAETVDNTMIRSVAT